MDYLYQASLHHENKNYKEAIKYYLLALEQEVNIDLLLELSPCYFDNNEENKALETLHKMILLDEKFPSTYYVLGMIYEKKDLNKSLSYYQKCLNLDPTYYQASYNLALLYEEINLNKAKEYYYQTLEIYDKHFWSLVNLSSILEQENNDQEALKYLKQALLIKEDAICLFNLGVIYKKLGDLKQAKNFYQKAITVDKPYIYAYLNYALLYKAEGNLFEAIKIYSLGLEYEENDILRYNRACCFALLKKYKEAYNDLVIAIKDNKDLQAYMHYDQELTEVITLYGL